MRDATYAAYRSGLGPDGHQVPADFQHVVQAVIDFADPLAEDREPSRRWNPHGRNWEG
ncbi:MAG TPA: hypothetical protein VE441_02890 [Mycobacterium sp.]|nr:hypothetical protein [Mycobacterium sp.]